VSLDFSLIYSLRSHYDPGVDSASNINEYQEYFLGVKVAGADFLKIWEIQPPGTLRASQGLQLDCFTFTLGYEILYLVNLETEIKSVVGIC
jgi:hypothetical protein